VMAAASKNLCPVTLELGGKAPALICDDFPLQKATERITFFKYFNAGQICTTADHVFVPANKVNAFVEIAKRTVSARYPDLDTPDYTSIIDARAFNRIIHAMAEAQSRGATLVQLTDGKKWDEATRKIAPHIVLNAPADCALRTREIFGPVLPVIPYTSIEEVVQSINSGPRPLAFYPFSHDKNIIQSLLQRVMSGGATVNDIVLHTGQHDMPFGGVGDSGMGHYHGFEGFITFSKMRPVMYQAPFSAMKFMWPPYGKFATRYLDFLTR
jgi:coniferyl-aldehyde dehydrogenase